MPPYPQTPWLSGRKRANLTDNLGYSWMWTWLKQPVSGVTSSKKTTTAPYCTCCPFSKALTSAMENDSGLPKETVGDKLVRACPETMDRFMGWPWNMIALWWPKSASSFCWWDGGQCCPLNSRERHNVRCLGSFKQKLHMCRIDVFRTWSKETDPEVSRRNTKTKDAVLLERILTVTNGRHVNTLTEHRFIRKWHHQTNDRFLVTWYPCCRWTKCWLILPYKQSATHCLLHTSKL